MAFALEIEFPGRDLLVKLSGHPSKRNYEKNSDLGVHSNNSNRPGLKLGPKLGCGMGDLRSHILSGQILSYGLNGPQSNFFELLMP